MLYILFIKSYYDLVSPLSFFGDLHLGIKFRKILKISDKFLKIFFKDKISKNKEIF